MKLNSVVPALRTIVAINAANEQIRATRKAEAAGPVKLQTLATGRYSAGKCNLENKERSSI